MKDLTPVRWGVMWRSDSLFGRSRHLMYENRIAVMFVTRREAREWIKKNYGYISSSPDLQIEPHGWKMPVPVKVRVVLVDQG